MPITDALPMHKAIKTHNNSRRGYMLAWRVLRCIAKNNQWLLQLTPAIDRNLPIAIAIHKMSALSMMMRVQPIDDNGRPLVSLPTRAYKNTILNIH